MFNMAKSQDKDFIVIEGAVHGLSGCTPNVNCTGRLEDTRTPGTTSLTTSRSGSTIDFNISGPTMEALMFKRTLNFNFLRFDFGCIGLSSGSANCGHEAIFPVLRWRAGVVLGSEQWTDLTHRFFGDPSYKRTLFEPNLDSGIAEAWIQCSGNGFAVQG